MCLHVHGLWIHVIMVVRRTGKKRDKLGSMNQKISDTSGWPTSETMRRNAYSWKLVAIV